MDEVVSCCVLSGIGVVLLMVIENRGKGTGERGGEEK